MLRSQGFDGGTPDKLDLTAFTVTGQSLGEGLKGAANYDRDIIRPLSNPIYGSGSLAVLRGNLAPDGAVIKPAACDPKFHRHSGPAVVADSYPELKRIIDDPDYPITTEHVLVLRNAGPKGGPGMPEWGHDPSSQGSIEGRASRHVEIVRRKNEWNILWCMHPSCRTPKPILAVRLL